MAAMKYFPELGIPSARTNKDERNSLVVLSQNFGLLNGLLFEEGNDEIWHKVNRDHQDGKELRESHYGMARDQNEWECYRAEFWQGGLWQPIVCKDVYAYSQDYNLYQQIGQP